MKKNFDGLAALFWTAVAGVGFCFVMTVVTAVREHHTDSSAQPQAIVTPAQ